MLSDRRRVFAVVAVLALIVAGVGGYLFLNRPAPAAASAAATLTVFTGSASLEKSGANSFSPTHTGTALAGGDTVQTGPATKASIMFADGSQTRLDENTTLKVKNVTKSGGGYQTDLEQTAGKTWNNIKSLAGRSSFQVHGPNNSTAEVRGTEFSVVVTKDANGRPVVRINTFSGTVVVKANDGTVTVTGGLSTTVNSGQPPAPVVTIPAGDKTDPWTVYNQAQSANTGSVTANVNSGTLSQGGSTPVTAGATGDGNTDLSFTLSWPGSKFAIAIYDPEGIEYVTETSAVPPITVTVARARPGKWSFKVIDIESGPNEAWAVVVGQTSPSTQTPTPFFVGSTGCAHGVNAGNTDLWTVASRSSAGRPALSVGTLPAYGNFRDNGDGTGTFTFNPPVDLASSEKLALTITASLGGASASLNCSETVNAAIRASVISGRASAAGAGLDGVTITLTRPDGTSSAATTASGGGYSFTGLGAGTYTVSATRPSGYTQSSPGTVTVTVTGTDTQTANFSFAPPPTPTPSTTPSAAPSTSPTPSPSPSPSASPSPSPSPSPPVRPTPSAAPNVTSVNPRSGPSAGGQTVTVTGSGFSSANAVLVGTAGMTQPHTGSFSAQLQWTSVNRDSGGDSYLRQNITVPATGTSTLTFWTREFCYDGLGYDWSEAYVRDINGNNLAQIFHECPESSTQQWTQHTFDLSPYAGLTVQLWFSQHGDNYSNPDNSFMFLDDVVVTNSTTTGNLVVNGGFENGDLGGWYPGTTFEGGFAPRLAPSFTLNSDTSLTFVSPQQPSSVPEIQVINEVWYPEGPNSSPNPSAFYSYTCAVAPTVYGVSPYFGSSAGGTTVTIRGNCLAGATAVNFGATPATTIGYANDPYSPQQRTLLVAVAPSSAGYAQVDLTVTTAAGTSATSTSDQFTFYETPAITSLSPASGPDTGGTSVTIRGSGFKGATGVMFGGQNATSFSIAPNGMSITAITPNEVAGPLPVAVINPAATSAPTSADVFTFTGIAEVRPAGGPTAGGTTVTISGAGFTGATAVHFGPPPQVVTVVPPPVTFTVVSDAVITATSPGHTAGPVDVQVDLANRSTTSISFRDVFTYYDPPVVTGITPTSGSTAGGTSVTITGTGFSDPANPVSFVAFGTTSAPFSTSAGSPTMGATSPAHAAGTVHVIVTTAYGGPSSPNQTDGFNFVPPTVTLVNPSTGPSAGGTPVTLTGSGFSGANAVHFGSAAAPTGTFTVVSDTQITVTSPPRAVADPLLVDITVGNAGATSAAGTTDRFTYQAPPSPTPSGSPTVCPTPTTASPCPVNVPGAALTATPRAVPSATPAPSHSP